MPIKLTYAEQATGIVLGADGKRQLGVEVPYSEVVRDMIEATGRIEAYFRAVPGAEAWINYREYSYRVTTPGFRGFENWILRYSETGDTGPITIGMDVGALISVLGLPESIGQGMGCRGLGCIFRYFPGLVDFHFLNDGTLFLVHDDDLDHPRTILQ